MSNEYVVVFEPDEDGSTASVPDLPGCFSDGETVEATEASIRQGIRIWIETAKPKVWPIPPGRVRIQRIAVWPLGRSCPRDSLV
ncbi:MAG: type II toxin-antitoxin system HicB family antitoxin [Fimbriimonadaceae bacterium]